MNGIKLFIRLGALAAILFVLGGLSQASAGEKLTVLDKVVIIDNIADKVRDAYVDTINVNSLYDGAIQGMIDKLDPHSSYMPPSTADDFDEKIRGNFHGIGISFIMMNNKITVIEIIENGPSQKVGLKSHDRIVKIDGKNAIGISEDEVKEKLRGLSGTEVTVHVERPGHPELLVFKIVRDKVEMDSVSHAYMIDDTSGYISLSRFSMVTKWDVSKAMAKLKAQGMKRLVFDLRYNAGGSLEAAIGVVNLFIEEGTIVSTKGRKNEHNRIWYADNTAPYADIPMIIMINHGSASASEIVAGAFQDHDRALIIGQTSFGKGLVMNPFHLEQKNGSKLGTLVLSVARYYTPSGRLIQRPYEGTKEDYIKEGFDDYDPNSVEENKEDKPVYQTDLKRQVYGGGGITPDKQLKPLKMLNELEKELRKTNIFFEYVDAHMMEKSVVPGSFQEFLVDYHIPENEFIRFRSFVKEKGIKIDNDSLIHEELKKVFMKYGVLDENFDLIKKNLAANGVNLNESLFESSRDFIERELKQELARIHWGPEEKYRIWHSSDTELAETLTYFNETEDLLKRRLALKGN